MKHIINVFFLVIGVGLILLFWRDSRHFSTLLIAVGFTFFIILSAGVLWLRANYFLTSIHKVQSPTVLLTFDDGPDPLTTPRILETLNTHGVKALFFIVGTKAEKHPEIVQQIIDNGHLIGNHTYSHPNLFALSSAKKVREEIQKGNEIIQRMTGKETIWFRPPIGYTNPIIARVIRSMGLTVIGWNKRSYDTVLKDPIKLEKRTLGLTTPGSIILLHDNLSQTEKMLPSYIAQAKENGIIFANEACINSLLK
jgi:peptidoglycan/xylan/chitin deacetylase (PgdA/CDA1 family)